eukprot:UN32626
MGLFMKKDNWLLNAPEGLMIGFTLACTFIFGLHYAYYYYSDKAKAYCKKRLNLFGGVTFSCFIVTCTAGPLDEPWVINITYMICITVLLVYQLNSFRVNTRQMPPNTEHMSERFGILVMILLGESVLALILNEVETTDSSVSSVIIAAFVVMYLLYDMYFRSHCHEETYHALTQDKSPGSVAWVALHLLLSYFLLCVGVGYKLLVSSLISKHTGDGNPKYY